MNQEQQRVENFIQEFHGAPIAKKVLDVFNNVDPMHVFYGDDVNPGEYIGYARRFIDSFNAIPNNCRDGQLWHIRTKVYIALVQSFHPDQLGKWVTWEEFGTLSIKMEKVMKEVLSL